MVRNVPLGNFLDRTRVLVFLFEADTCQHSLGQQTGGIKAPQFTAGENILFPTNIARPVPCIL